jgi:hypothetical protein
VRRLSPHTLVVTLGAALMLSSVAADSHAQGAGPTSSSDTSVTIAREAPFDKWCAAPFCKDAMRRPALVKVPAFIAPNATDGLLEQKTKRALSDALEAAAKATLGPTYNRAVADVAEAIAATVTTDRQRLEKLGGLGAAIVRGALAYHMDRIVESDPKCVGARRIDAIYAALGITVTLMPLDFFRGGDPTVSAACVDTAKRAARNNHATFVAAGSLANACCSHIANSSGPRPVRCARRSARAINASSSGVIAAASNTRSRASAALCARSSSRSA